MIQYYKRNFLEVIMQDNSTHENSGGFLNSAERKKARMNGADTIAKAFKPEPALNGCF